MWTTLNDPWTARPKSLRMVLRRTIEPPVEPVTVEELKAHSRILTNAEDLYVSSLIPAARRYVEEITARSLITQTWERKLDCFPWGREPILLPRPPVQSVTSVEYLDEAGNEQTLSTDVYVVDRDSEPGRITLEQDRFWPTTRRVPNAVTITYVAGYGNQAANVPMTLRQAIQLMAADLFEHREPQVVGATVSRMEFGLTALMAPYKIHWF